MKLFERIADLIFPSVCRICSCRIDEGILCKSCREKFIREMFEKCPICCENASKCLCGTDFTADLYTDIAGRYFFTLTFYKSRKQRSDDGRITERMIFSLKECGEFAAFFAGELSRGLKILFDSVGEDISEWCVTYAPRSTENFVKFGYDQGEDVARRLAKHLGAEFVKTFFRAESVQQKSLSSGERKINAQSSLVPIRSKIRQGGKYILLDDIIITGATAVSAAKIIYECGAAEVFPVSIARTMLKPEK